ncbi:metallophosphoesterase [Brevibacillus migulae]|uniref:metallophosphoesterase n=1 Tax=Brevibacillus migulae TaxID=1644114 RepID=UPI00106DDB54|nr:metallophosphoesterase [Brevibacillus migulae]
MKQDDPKLGKLVLELIGKWLDRIGIFAFFPERDRLEVHEMKLSLPRLPHSFEGFRICHFTDLHVGHYLDEVGLTRLVETITSCEPDLICFTGDLVDKDVNSLEEAMPFLQNLKAPAGKFAVLGNHDYRTDAMAVIQAWKQAGFCVLRNQHAAVSRAKERLYILGVDDVLYGDPQLEEALEGIPEAACKILLAHEPDYASTAAAYPIDLQLSGHSHGGRVRLPVVGHLLVPQLGSLYPDGYYDAGGSGLQVFTSRGVGTTLMPVRFLCPPQIAMITLQRVADNGQ